MKNICIQSFIISLISLFFSGALVWAGPNSNAGCALDLNYFTQNYDSEISNTDIESQRNAYLNDNIWVAVIAQNVSNLDTFQFEINFDTSRLQFIDAYSEISIDIKYNLLTQNGGEAPGFMASDNVPGTVNISNSLVGQNKDEAPDGTGIIAFLKFKLLDENDNNNLNLSNVFFVDSDGENDPITNLSNAVINPSSINSPPFAVDDTIIVFKNKATNIDVLQNDNDPEGNILSISSITQPTNGIVEIYNNTLTYTSNENFIGNDSFSYTITDGTCMDSATVFLTVEQNLLKLSLNDQKVQEGENVLVPVFLNNPDKHSIRGVYLIYEFDASIIDAVNVNFTDSVLKEYHYEIIQDTSVDNEILIGLYAQSSLLFSGEGLLANIEFNVVGNCGQSTDLSFKISEINELPVDCQGSVIQIVSPPTITSINDQIINEDSSSVALSFTVLDCDDNQLSLNVISDNTDLLPNDDSHIIITGTGDKRAIVIEPVENKSGQATITMQVTDSMGLFNSTSFSVNVNACADEPNINIGSSEITQYPNTPVPLSINASLNDTDNSEFLSVIVSDLPSGSTLSMGSKHGDGSWIVNSDQLENLKIVLPDNYLGDFQINVTAIATEQENDQKAQVTKTINVSVQGFYIAGKILYQNQLEKPVPNVLLTLKGKNTYTATTAIDGTYTITNIVQGDYELIPSKTDDDLGGISITDAGDIAMFVGRKETLTPFQKLAADVSLSGTIRPTDVTNVAIAATENNGQNCVNDTCIHWIFPVNEPEEFDPISYNSRRIFKSLNSNHNHQTFVGIRLGDIDNSWSADTGN